MCRVPNEIFNFRLRLIWQQCNQNSARIIQRKVGLHLSLKPAIHFAGPEAGVQVNGQEIGIHAIPMQFDRNNILTDIALRFQHHRRATAARLYHHQITVF